LITTSTNQPPFWIPPGEPHTPFPDASKALTYPNGLLAIGGDLSVQRIISAYKNGIFPWYSDGQPILWWSPDPRLVLFPEKLIIGRSLRKKLKQKPYIITFDQAFDQVILNCCTQTRPNQSGTWITTAMRQAYIQLHAIGIAHSVEAWQNDQLVGGLYGLALGKIFFGESMFSQCSDASKIAFVHLVKQLQTWNYEIIDCQVKTAHLNRFGAEEIPRAQLINIISQWKNATTSYKKWHINSNVIK